MHTHIFLPIDVFILKQPNVIDVNARESLSAGQHFGMACLLF